VLKAASGGAARRLVQTVVIFLVLTAGAAAGLLGLTLATSANEGFYASFAAAHGAHLAVTINASRVTAAELARTRHLPGVTQAVGPYPETYITLAAGRSSGPPFGNSHAPGRQTRTQHAPGQPRTGSPAGRSPHGNGATAQPSPPSGIRGPLIPHGFVKPNTQVPGQGLSLVGRASMGGPLDHLILLSGR
jgi:putative ABC transport system permease protein